MADPAPTASLAADDARPSWTRTFTRISFALAVVALGVTIWSVGPTTLLHQLGAIGLGFVAVVLLEVVITLCDSAALSVFLGTGGRRSSFLHVLRAQVAGRAINAVTPLGSLGEATKATTLMERTSSQRAIAAVFQYNLAELGVRLLTIAAGTPVCALVLDLPRAVVVLLLVGSGLAGAVLAGGIALWRRGMLATLVAAGRRVRVLSAARAKRWRERVAPIDAYRAADGGGFRARWLALVWIVVSRALSLASMWAVLRSVGYHAGVGTIAAIGTAGALLGMVSSVVPMGLGLSEGSNAALFTALGAPASLGVTMVVGGRVTLVAYAVVGLFMLAASTAAVHGVRRVRPLARRLRGRRRRDAAMEAAETARAAALIAVPPAGPRP
ncbi:MAG TPA: lysylphosphatidylglycerol synthase transmembrane domain-containing protein [Kofleriaceae bacterium]|nr:lysylphosphatidylglycerol synthase transmembrane domain-containing protein [Kofleriaceae bacterium]